MRSRILLTGKCGQVGSALQAFLSALGELVAIDRADLDLLALENIRRFIRDCRPQIIINVAAYTGVDAAETDQANARVLNAEVPGVLAEEAKKQMPYLCITQLIMFLTVRKHSRTRKLITRGRLTYTEEQSSPARRPSAARGRGT